MENKQAILIANSTDLSEVLLRGLHINNQIIFSNYKIFLKYKNYKKYSISKMDYIVVDFRYRRLINAKALMNFLKKINELLTFVDHACYSCITIISLSKRLNINIKYVNIYKVNVFVAKKFNGNISEYLKKICENKYLKNSYSLYKFSETYGSDVFINMPFLKRSFIDRYISIEEFRKNFKYKSSLINNRPCPNTKNFLWIDSALSKDINKHSEFKNFINKYSNLFTIKKHPNEELSSIAKSMIDNGAKLMNIDLPMELFSFRKEVVIISPVFSTYFNSSKKILPNKLVSLIKIFGGDGQFYNYYFGKYDDVEFIDNIDCFIKLIKK